MSKIKEVWKKKDFKSQKTIMTAEKIVFAKCERETTSMEGKFTKHHLGLHIESLISGQPVWGSQISIRIQENQANDDEIILLRTSVETTEKSNWY